MPSLGQSTTKKKEEKPESSFMFSLKELSHMERERLRAETEAARLAGEAIVQQREAEERRAQEETLRRQQEAEKAEREELWRARELEAKVEAEKVSRIEAARIEAEAASRRHVRAAELEVEKVRVAAGASSARRSAVWALVGASVAAAVALIVEVGLVKPREDQKVAELGHQVSTMGQQLDELKVSIEARETRMGEMKRDLASARDEAHRLSDENQGLRTQATTAKPPPAISGGTIAVAPKATVTVPTGGPIPPGFRDCHGKINGDPNCWR